MIIFLIKGIWEILLLPAFQTPCLLTRCLPEAIGERGGTKRWVQPWEGGNVWLTAHRPLLLSSCVQKSDQVREAGLEEGFKVESPPPGCWAPRASASQHLMLPDGNQRRFHRTSGPWSLGLWRRWRWRSTVKIWWRWWTRTAHRAPVKAQRE